MKTLLKWYSVFWTHSKTTVTKRREVHIYTFIVICISDVLIWGGKRRRSNSFTKLRPNMDCILTNSAASCMTCATITVQRSIQYKKTFQCVPCNYDEDTFQSYSLSSSYERHEVKHKKFSYRRDSARRRSLRCWRPVKVDLKCVEWDVKPYYTHTH